MSVDNAPKWDIADRLRKSLREAGIGVSDMADYLGVGRGTVSNWINGRNPAPMAALRLWAMRCGVPLEWLQTGNVGVSNTSGEYWGESEDLTSAIPGLELPVTLAA